MRIYNDRYGKRYNFVRYTNDLVGYWTMQDWLKEIKDKNLKELQQLDSYSEAISIWNNDDVQRHCGPEPGAWALNLFLARHGIIPYKITSRPSTSRKNTYYWYKNNFPWIPEEYIFVQKGEVPDPDFKRDKIRELGVLFHLDDSVEHALKIAGLGVWVGLVPKPWNEGFVTPNGLRIVTVKQYDKRPGIIRTFLSLRNVYMQSRYSLSQL
jgi:hypothetical protein